MVSHRFSKQQPGQMGNRGEEGSDDGIVSKASCTDLLFLIVFILATGGVVRTV